MGLHGMGLNRTRFTDRGYEMGLHGTGRSDPRSGTRARVPSAKLQMVAPARLGLHHANGQTLELG